MDTSVSVKKSGTGYEVTFGKDTIITLPEGSKYTDDMKTQIGKIGTTAKYLQLSQGFVVDLIEKGNKQNIVDGDEDAYDALVSEWEKVEAEEKAKKGARRRSRLNRKTRRSKRNRRHTKHRKLRKLATRRR